MFHLSFERLVLRNFTSVTQAMRLSKSGTLNCKVISIITQSRCYVQHTSRNAYCKWLKKFTTEGISEPRESIEILLSHVLGKEHHRPLSLEEPLSVEQTELLERICECRLARMPLQYIIGEWQFRGLKLRLLPPVFIPRSETETLVDLVVEKLSQMSGPVRIIEVGCGSGAISLAIAHESSKVTCTAIDQCDLACHLAKKNAMLLNLSDNVKISWAKLTDEGEIMGCSSKLEISNEIPKKVDIVVSNPPYVPHQDLFHLQPEILLYEDLKALDGGKDGLRVVIPLMVFASAALKSASVDGNEGTLLIEIDPSHPALIKKWLSEVENSKLGLQLKKVHLDLFGKERFVEITKL